MGRRDDCPLSPGLSGRVSCRRERTERRGRYGPWNGLSTDTLDGGQGRGSPHTWIATGGSAARAGLEGIQPQMGRVPASIVDACVRVPVCVFPAPPLPPSALRHAPRPRLPGQPEPEVPDGGWGGGVPRKGDPVLPAHADWGRRAPTWDTDGGGSHRTALFPPLPRAAPPPQLTPPQPPWFFWASRGHPPAEGTLWQEGRVRGPSWGTRYRESAG